MKLQHLIVIVSAALMAVSASAEEIVIGHAGNFSQSGSSAINPFNKDTENGMKLAIADLSAELAKKNLSVKIENFDYGQSDVRALSTAKAIVASSAISVIGFYESGQALLAAPILNEAKVPFLSPLSSARRLYEVGPYVFHMSFSNGDMGTAIANFAVQKLKAKKALVITSADCAYCSDLSDAVIERASKLKLEVKQVRLLSKDTNPEGVDRAIKTEDYDVIIVPNYEIDSARLVSRILSAGVNKPFIGGDGWADANGQGFLKIVTSKSFVGYCTSHWVESYSKGFAKGFATRYFAKFNTQPSSYSAVGYDSMRRTLLALIESKVRTREGFQKALVNLKSFDGVMGAYSFPTSRKGPNRPLNIMKSDVSAGRFEFFQYSSVESRK